MDEKLVWEWRCANHIVTPVWCSDGLGTRPLGKRAKRLRTETPQKAWPWFNECFLSTFALIGFSQNVCITLRYYTSTTSVLWSITIPTSIWRTTRSIFYLRLWRTCMLQSRYQRNVAIVATSLVKFFIGSVVTTISWSCLKLMAKSSCGPPANLDKKTLRLYEIEATSQEKVQDVVIERRRSKPLHVQAPRILQMNLHWLNPLPMFVRWRVVRGLRCG